MVPISLFMGQSLTVWGLLLDGTGGRAPGQQPWVSFSSQWTRLDWFASDQDC